MVDVLKITIEEFEEKIFDYYLKLFPKEEQRNWKKVHKTYDNGIENFYKITLDEKIIGFFMLEKIKNHPYYLDYFAIFKEYQNRGNGTKALKKLIESVTKEDGLIAEIEKVDDSNPITKNRLKFYESIGFKLINSEYSLYKVLYNPIVCFNNHNKEDIDTIFFDYYLTNIGEVDLKNNCYIVK